MIALENSKLQTCSVNPSSEREREIDLLFIGKGRKSSSVLRSSIRLGFFPFRLNSDCYDWKFGCI